MPYRPPRRQRLRPGINWDAGINAVRQERAEAARWMRDSASRALYLAELFAPDDQNAFLAAFEGALVCDQPGCDCGGYRGGHWPQMLTKCQVAPVDGEECPCGGNYPPHRQAAGGQ